MWDSKKPLHSNYYWETVSDLKKQTKQAEGDLSEVWFTLSVKRRWWRKPARWGDVGNPRACEVEGGNKFGASLSYTVRESPWQRQNKNSSPPQKKEEKKTDKNFKQKNPLL